MEKLRGRITYANVVASAALFIALGGAAYAATQPPKDSVGSRQLRKGAVRTGDIGHGAVTLGKIQSAAQQALRLDRLGRRALQHRTEPATGTRLRPLRQLRR